ncbi:MAG: hypothetical protein LBR40_04410, partial [Bacilli bacterium]|nr:hypothetical protein [Bacilli bacterium]
MMKKFFLVLLFLFGICSMFFLKYDILASTNNYYVNKVNQANIINTNDLFNIKNNQTIIESGKTAKFTLHLHVSGNDIVYKNVHIEININNQSDDFYFDNNLNDYAISGIKPKLNKNKHLLIYDIKELKAGINYNLVYKVNSQSGLIDDGEELKINASFKADNLINDNNKSSKIVSNALVKYSANGKISLTNKFTSVLGTNLIAPNPKTDIYWDFSVTIPYNGYGDKFIEEYEPIIITYEVDANIPIVNIKELNNQPFRGIKNKDKDSGKNIFTIKIVPPSYEKQRELSKNGYLLNYNFRIHGFVSEKTPEFSWLTNDLKADIKFINDNQPITKSLQAKVMCMSQTLGNHHSDGNLNSIYSIGPYNDKGYLGSWKNQDIKVHDNALLAFGLGLTVGPANDNEVGPQYYSLYYHIDDNLNLEKWYSGDFYYSPDSTNFHWKKQIPLNYPLRYDLYVKYGTSNNLDKEWTLLLKNVKPKTLYHNLNKGKHIGEFRLVVERNGKEREYYDHSEWNDEKQDWDLIYKKVKAVPAGFFSNSVIGYYTVNKGYIGKVSNSISNVIIVNGYGANGLLSNYCTGVNKDNYLDLPKEEKIYKNCNIDEKSNQLLSDSEDWTDVWKKYWGPQTANIVSKEIGEDKVVTTNVSFSYSNGNLIDDESNMVYVNIVNDSASNSNIKGPFTSYVLLPQGVKYSPKQNEYNEFKTS